MTARYDLRVEGWIPVQAGPALGSVGLRELFLRAQELTDLAVAVPPAAAGLWRILYAVAYRVSGLDDPGLTVEEWLARRYALLDAGSGFDPQRVEEYFRSDRFDLFHPHRPWLQDPRLRTQCARPSGVNKLVFSRPSGSNQVWFGHFDDARPVPLSPAEAAWYLIAQVYYGAAGRCATRTVATTSEANSTAGPLRGSVSYHPLAANLFQSLLCGLRPPDEMVTDPASDLAPWEHPELPDPLGRPTPPSWPVRALVGRARHAVLLVPSADGGEVRDAYLTWAWRAAGLPGTDGYLLQRLSREGTYYVPLADHARALWRDLDALITESPPGADRIRPAVFDHLDGWLPDSVWAGLRVRAYGFDQDRQTRDKQWFMATTPPVLRFLRKEETAAQARIGELRVAAEDAEAVLKASLREAWLTSATPGNGGRKKNNNPGPWVARAVSFYWPRAERVFWEHADAPLPRSPRELFGRVAQDAIDHAVGDQERQVRVARCVAQARRRVGGFVRKGMAG